MARRFTDYASRVAPATGKPLTVALCVVLVLVWAGCAHNRYSGIEHLT